MCSRVLWQQPCYCNNWLLALQEGKPIPKLSAILEDSDSEEEPDAVVEINANKVKLVVGPGGERIKLIQKKSKARLQVRTRLRCPVDSAT